MAGGDSWGAGLVTGSEDSMFWQGSSRDLLPLLPSRDSFSRHSLPQVLVYPDAPPAPSFDGVDDVQYALTYGPSDANSQCDGYTRDAGECRDGFQQPLPPFTATTDHFTAIVHDSCASYSQLRAQIGPDDYVAPDADSTSFDARLAAYLNASILPTEHDIVRPLSWLGPGDLC